MSAEQTIELNGKTYPMLADGQYDCIILGTGLKECMLAGLLSKKGMKVNVNCFHYPVGDGFRSKWVLWRRLRVTQFGGWVVCSYS